MRILAFARAVAACFLLSLFVQPCLATAGADALPAPTVVTLTFDDAIGSQYAARSMFASHGMHGTFYINSGNVGANSYYMNWVRSTGSPRTATRSAATRSTIRGSRASPRTRNGTRSATTRQRFGTAVTK